MKDILLVAADKLEEEGMLEASSYLRREPAFVTGSRAYGTPMYQSDVDLVILVSESDLEILKRALPYGGKSGSHKTMRHCTSFKVGSLNLLCTTDLDVWQKWRAGTDELITKKPTTKSVAIATFAALFGELVGVDEDAPKPDPVWDDS